VLLGRIGLSLYGGHKYVSVGKDFEGTASELDNIKKLCEHHKALQEGFTKL